MLRTVTGLDEQGVVTRHEDGNRVEVVLHAGSGKTQTLLLLLLWAGEGFPDDVERALELDPGDSAPVVVARHFSQGALRLLENRGVSYADESGRARIDNGQGLLVVRGPAAPVQRVVERKRKPFRFAPSSRDLAEWLLSTQTLPYRAIAFSASDLADKLPWSHQQLTSVLRRFDQEGWTVKRGPERGPTATRELAEPGALLEAWAQAQAELDDERVSAHELWTNPIEYLRSHLAPTIGIGTRWAVSGWAGLELAAPYVTTVPVVHVYMERSAFRDGRLDKLFAGPTSMRRVDSGARIEFRPADEVTLALTRRHNGIGVVGPARLYADLLALGGRGIEAAEHAREELLGF